MKEVREIDIIDYAVNKTREKSSQYNNIQYVTDALKRYLFTGKSNGFTRQQGARGYLESLNQDAIKKELLANIIKINALKEYNHEATLLNTRKNYTDDLSIDETELVALKMLRSMHKEQIGSICVRYPRFYEQLIKSFVYRRYFDHLHNIDSLDNPEILTGMYALDMETLDMDFSNYNGPKY